MLRILLLSDIHFIHCEDDENEYRSLESAFVEAMDEVRDSGGLDQILICGDIANAGQESEYEKAEKFLQEVLEHLGCNEHQTQIYVAPGNHDVNRNTNKETRLALRPTLLDPSKSDNFIKNAKHVECNTLKIIYSPLREFYKFANAHSSIDGIAEGILSEAPNFNDKGFRKEVELGILDNYIVKLHCLNSALLCDIEDVNDPRSMKVGEHKLYIPRFAYNVETNSTVVNISMMHHPHAWFVNDTELRTEFDRKFKFQIYGHVHTQCISQDEEGKSAIRLQVGSLHPGNEGDPALYPPIYNILEIDIVRSVLKVKVNCYSWDGEEFVKNNKFSYQRRVALKKKKSRTTNQRKEVSKMKTAVEMSDEVYAIRYRFFNSEHIKEIICEINAKAYDDNKPEYANAMAFFKTASSKTDVIEKLGAALTKYGE
ncbi:MAG: metallophosphoesterase [Bacteroidales bacterium]|nr:metallophosphoesterase [Bacteroidales bacterium]